ncbi:MAG: arginine--tRNA ligase [Clostridia bacterium]|nr:arginine--tRNA ligase [Clostridia bacterium]MDR3645031.1 arginine--tRNA ligase [Clostridia bacterium]
MGRCVAQGLLPAEPCPAFTIEVPADRSHGDLAANVAMISARAFRLAPRKIAEAITSNLELSGTMASRAEVAGPGFINFFLAPQWYSAVLEAVLSEGPSYGSCDLGRGSRVMVEFVSANPTGPMHMGNARGGALGDCLASLLEKAGYAVTREFYINDAGNQIDKFALSLEARYLQLFRGEEAIPFPEDGYHGEDITTRAREFAALRGDTFVDAEPAARREALVEYALPRNVEKLCSDLEKYRIRYDVWFKESQLHNDGELSETIRILKDGGFTYEKEGALWYAATNFGADKDEVLIRANGNPTYFAADIAYHRNKFLVRGFDRVINVWGADHHGHVARLKGAMNAIGIDGSRLDIVLMQLVRLTRNGEIVRMSKRTGKAISLDDLLEDVPVDAARFFFNLREANSHLEFDLDLAVEQSAKNPVYYVQYAHARIWSILKNLMAEGIMPRKCTGEEFTLLTAPEERELIMHLALLPQTIAEAAKTYDPARLTRYVIELATNFHKFYNTQRVKGEEEPLMQARLNLCICVRDVIKNVLDMLKITAPERM